MTSTVKLTNVSKQFGNQLAVNNVSLDILRGDIYGLIGRNGAGKTTIIKMITSLITPTSGTISVLGSQTASELQKALKHTASIIEAPAAYENLSAHDNLEYYRLQRGITDKTVINKVLKTVNLEGTGKKKFKSFSLGMKQRLGIAIALLNTPDFIILDEPINGLDPIAIIEFREMLLTLNKEYNITILISSHILSELYHVANRFGIIHEGTIIKEFSKVDFDASAKAYIEVIVDNEAKAAIVLKDILGVEYKTTATNTFHIYNYTEDISEINFQLNQAGVRVTVINEVGVDLESYFTQLIGEVK